MTNPLEQVLEALLEANSVCSSIETSKERRIRRDGFTLYTQTEEWCAWAEEEVQPKVAAAITTLRAHIEAEKGWKPIESAPKDGTKFLAWRRGQIATAFQTPRQDCEMWSFGGMSAAFETYPEIKPTHWMPLPQPPAIQAGTSERGKG